ncbi:MAG: hypothetical protein Q3964_01100 [Carnobacterium sp.]|nr:hypothetical protein [Carnobacterium sp.]
MENRQLLDLQKLELDSSLNINVNSEDSSCTSCGASSCNADPVPTT